MTDNWLQLYLLEAVRRNLCTRIRCTTCLAHECRYDVLTAWANATGQPVRQDFDHAALIEITMALQPFIRPNSIRSLRTRFAALLFDLWSGIPVFEREIETIL